MWIFFWFPNSTVVSGPDFLLFLLRNLRIQAHIYKALCRSNLCSIKSKSSWTSAVVMAIDLCSFEILTSFFDSTDGSMNGCLGLSLTCNQEEPFHQTSGIFVSKLPLLSKLAGFSLVGTYCQLISLLSKILLTLFLTNWLLFSCPFNQHNTTLLSVHYVTDLTFWFFKADFTFDIKFHAICVETNSNLRIVRSLLEIRDLLESCS